MSAEDVEKVMNLAFCTEDEAKDALQKTCGDIVDAIDMLLKVPPTAGAPKKKELDEVQTFFAKMRVTTETLNESIEESMKKSKMSGQHDSSVSVDLPVLHEETALQNSCSQICPPPSPELTVQTQEIACQSQSESIYDLQ